MKVRTGFVSNSSSSSFIIISKGSKTIAEVLQDRLNEEFKDNENSLFYKSSEDMINTIIHNIEDSNLDTLLSNFCCKSLEELHDEFKSLYDLIKKYEAEEFQIASFMIDWEHNFSINFEDDTLLIKSMEDI